MDTLKVKPIYQSSLIESIIVTARDSYKPKEHDYEVIEKFDSKEQVYFTYGRCRNCKGVYYDQVDDYGESSDCPA